jgi:hypothetical protein
MILVKKNMPVAVEVINGQSICSGLVMHETKASDINIGTHTSKVVGLQCHFIPNKPYHHWFIMVHFAQPSSGLVYKEFSF